MNFENADLFRIIQILYYTKSKNISLLLFRIDLLLLLQFKFDLLLRL